MISLIQLLKESLSNPKALILAGAPGSGKGSILQDLDLKGLTILNVDDNILALSKIENFSLNQKDTSAKDRSKFMKAMQNASKKLKQEQLPKIIANKESFILDGTSSSSEPTLELKNKLQESGYDVMMLYVYTDLETSLKRNQNRFEKSKGKDRSLVPSSILQTWLKVSENFPIYKKSFSNFVSVSNLGKKETMKSVEDILKNYIYPFIPRDGRDKTDKEKLRDEKNKEKLNKDLQSFLQSDKTQNIIASSVSKEEAQSKINQFLK